MHFAAIDLGSNTIATLVQKQHAGKLTTVAEYAECTRLGENLAQTANLTPAAMQRTLAAASRQCQLVQRHFHPYVMTVVGTSAVREAVNGQDFLHRCQQELSLQTVPIALSAEQEASLSFRGATSSFAPTTMICNFDVGGASTEISIGHPRHLQLACSLPAGCVRWRDQFGLSDIFSDREITAASQAALSLLRPHRQPLQRLLSTRPRDFSVTVTGGTGTALAALLNHCDDRDASLHGYHVTLPVMRDCLHRLASLPAAARESLPGLPAGRGSVLPAGLIILSGILQDLGLAQIMINRHGLRHGLTSALQDCDQTLPVNLSSNGNLR